jgi:hypothetical protein
MDELSKELSAIAVYATKQREFQGVFGLPASTVPAEHAVPAFHWARAALRSAQRGVLSGAPSS